MQSLQNLLDEVQLDKDMNAELPAPDVSLADDDAGLKMLSTVSLIVKC